MPGGVTGGDSGRCRVPFLSLSVDSFLINQPDSQSTSQCYHVVSTSANTNRHRNKNDTETNLLRAFCSWRLSFDSPETREVHQHFATKTSSSGRLASPPPQREEEEEDRYRRYANVQLDTTTARNSEANPGKHRQANLKMCFSKLKVSLDFRRSCDPVLRDWSTVCGL